MADLSKDKQLHIVMFPYFAFGHISPFVQLSNKLSLHGVKISFLSAPGNIARIRTTFKLTPSADIIPLPIPAVDALPRGIDSTSEMTPAMAELLKQALDMMQPQVETLLSHLKPDFVFFDFAQYWLPKMATRLGIKSVHFSVYSAVSGAYTMVLSRQNNCSMEDLRKPPTGFPQTSVASIKEFVAQNFTYVYTRFGGQPSVFDRSVQVLNDCTAMVFKTCNEMEGPYVDFLRTQFQKPVLLSGPLVPDPPSGDLEEKWATWLSQFPANSVIYCSFGSETFLSKEQINELACGLEQTGLPFFLVLNFSGDCKDAQSELQNVLPCGFVERVKNRGIVHTGWVQQQLILAHTSVGCYVNHSGFSSIIEAIINDCQLVLLPFKGDQFLNSMLVAGDLKAGVEVNRRDSDGYFRKDDILKAVTTLMVDVHKEPGVSIRANHKKLKEFLLNEEIHSKFIEDLVRGLKTIA